MCRNYLKVALFLSCTFARAEIALEDTFDQESWITIFVHGIISVKPHLTLPNIIRLMKDDIADSVYARAVEIIRKDDFFYQYHAMQGLGLLPIELYNYEKGAATAAFARTFDAINRLANPHSDEHAYFTFGWSGLLSQKMWRIEAELFYENLQQLIDSHRAQGKLPKIRVIGYSHGGTFAMRLALFDNGSFHVDELWLVGVPVLPESYDFISHPFFRKIDHFYSLGDRIQRLDCFNRFFSDRIFYPSAKKSLPEKLTQIQIKFRRAAASNKRCTVHPEGCRVKNRAKMRNADPGHTELWSFGWAPSNYRERFPLNPLPTTVCLPYFVQAIRDAQMHGQHLAVEVYPHLEQMVLNASNKQLECPFIPLNILDILKNDVLDCRPEDYTAAAYSQKVQEAIEKAQLSLACR
jgi:hypothetical protein